MQGQRPPYQVMMTDEGWAAIKALPHEHQQDDALKFLFSHASNTPTTPIPGKLKRLKGEHNHLWQFDIDRSYRILYEVDETAKTVRIEYIGNHPSWGRRSSGGRRVRR